MGQLDELVAELQREAAELRQKTPWSQSDWDLAKASTLESVVIRIQAAVDGRAGQ